MADPLPDSARDSHTESEPGDGLDPTTTGPPRWVKVSAIVALIVVVLLIIVLLSGGHGPSRHTSADGGMHGQTPPVTAGEHGTSQQ